MLRKTFDVIVHPPPHRLDQVTVMIPSSLFTGAPVAAADYMYLCRMAVVALNAIKDVMTSQFSQQVNGHLLCPGEKFIDHSLASSLSMDYECLSLTTLEKVYLAWYSWTYIFASVTSEARKILPVLLEYR